MNVLILGASGFLGNKISLQLDKTTAQVTCANRGTRTRSCAVFEHNKPESLIEIIKNKQFDVVLNLVAAGLEDRLSIADEGWEVNSIFPSTLASILADVSPQTMLLHFASALEISHGSGPVSDDYTASKMEGTKRLIQSVQNSAPKLGIVYLNSVYGPGQPRSRFIANTIQKLRSGQRVELQNPENLCDFIYVSDVTDWLSTALDPPLSPFFAELTSGEQFSVRVAAETIADSLGATHSLISNQPGLGQRPSKPVHKATATAVPRKYFCPTSFFDGVRLTILSDNKI